MDLISSDEENFFDRPKSSPAKRSRAAAIPPQRRVEQRGQGAVDNTSTRTTPPSQRQARAVKTRGDCDSIIRSLQDDRESSGDEQFGTPDIVSSSQPSPIRSPHASTVAVHVPHATGFTAIQPG